jgi:hypothetical protein
MKFSRVISRVRWFSLVETIVSKTISVLVLRVVEIIWVRWTTQSFYLYLSKLRSGPSVSHWGYKGLGCPPNPDYFYDPEDEDRDGLRNVGLY